jgi:catechol 2,3-dioxygenase-like lactoylglutathione lyase family enzyme
MLGDMTIQRMDHVGVVVDDLEAAIAFFVELGMELEGEAPVEGRWVDRVVGLDDVRVDIAMMRTPDGHGRLELTKFHTPTAVSAEPENAPANTLGIRRIMFAVEDIEDVLARLHTHGADSLASWSSTRTAIGSVTSAAPRASSSHWPSSSTEGCRRGRSPKESSGHGSSKIRGKPAARQRAWTLEDLKA